MNRRDEELLRAFGEATEPRDAQLDRLRRRMQASAPSPSAAKALLPLLPGPSVEQLHSLRLRLERSRTSAARRPVRIVLPTMALLAAAAVLLFLFWPQSQFSPQPLAAPSESVTVQPMDELRLSYVGEGELHGTASEPLIRWDWGRIEVALEPEAGIPLEIRTPDGYVQVVGTQFSVDVGTTETTVAVSEGRVLVACGADTALLETGQSRTCLPGTDARWLTRINARYASEGATEELLAELHDQQPYPEGTGYELRRLDVELLSQLGHFDEALLAAEAFAELDGPRRQEALAGAAALGHALHGCERARPHLLELRKLDQLGLVPELTPCLEEAP